MKENDNYQTTCPECGSKLTSYHTVSWTKRICMKRCSGDKVVVLIDHRKTRIFLSEKEKA